MQDEPDQNLRIPYLGQKALGEESLRSPLRRRDLKPGTDVIFRRPFGHSGGKIEPGTPGRIVSTNTTIEETGASKVRSLASLNIEVNGERITIPGNEAYDLFDAEEVRLLTRTQLKEVLAGLSVLSAPHEGSEVAPESVEIEMKYRLSAKPELVSGDNVDTKDIEQAYLDYTEEDVASFLTEKLAAKPGFDLAKAAEARVRKKGEKFIVTVKSEQVEGPDGPMRLEWEADDLSAEEYARFADKSREKISKTRYTVVLDEEHDLSIEVDLFAGRHDGLYLAEVEITRPLPPSLVEPYGGTEGYIDHLIAQRLPDVQAVNVTADKSYKNKNLAKSEVPPEPFGLTGIIPQDVQSFLETDGFTFDAYTPPVQLRIETGKDGNTKNLTFTMTGVRFAELRVLESGEAPELVDESVLGQPFYSSAPASLFGRKGVKENARIEGKAVARWDGEVWRLGKPGSAQFTDLVVTDQDGWMVFMH